MIKKEKKSNRGREKGGRVGEACEEIIEKKISDRTRRL